ncbi:MAG: DUF2157 domain-containing protein [Desulfobulbaceae bacterium]|jgi:uncharacterized membrane protein|nr:DUF2157 domain-containing protein [Desulfobulbaceae bacterium]
MNDSKLAGQIIAELPSLVAKSIIDASAAAALRRHYEGQIKPARSLAIGLVITAILGGLLVGAGIILLLAHNWDDLSKPVRAFLSVLPLLISIALSGYTILRRMDSTAWREGCGVFYFLSIGASIALVSQTYHLYNDMAGFLFYWIVLTLPVIYLLNSGTAFAGCLACLVAYSFVLSGYWWRSGFPFSPKPFALLALALPYYGWHVWRHREALSVIWTSWALAVALPLIMLKMVERTNAASVWAVYGLLAVVYYLAGCRWFSERSGFKNPFRALGSLAIVVVAIAFTYKGIYVYKSWHVDLSLAAECFGIVATLAWLALAGDLLRRKVEFNIVAVLLPVSMAFAIALEGDGAALFLANIYMLALGIFTLLKGVRRDRLLLMNEGLIVITALIVSRFFDNDYSFVVRGVAFILLGCGFLAVNLSVMNKRRQQQGGAS